MGYFVVLCIVAAMTGCCRVTTGKKPDLSTAHGQRVKLRLDVHSELRITCYADGSPVWFSFPESTFLTTRSKYEMHESENGTLTFLRPRVTYPDAGWYACAEEGVEIEQDFRNLNHSEQDVSWIFVYVVPYFRDEKPGFVDNGVTEFVKYLIAVAGSTVVIPCRTVLTELWTQLWQNNKRRWFSSLYRPDDVVRCDARIGCIMEKIDFVDGRAFLQCRVSYSETQDNYVLLYAAGPKPTMFTAHGDEVLLQEGDELRIECSNETKLSFMFPKLTRKSSPYEIVRNENGTGTFLRRSVISDDTGWYGCGALDIGDDYIPDHSINYTRKEIAWIYVYVNSSVGIIAQYVDASTQDFATTAIIPCKQTSPEAARKIYIAVSNMLHELVPYFRHPDSQYDASIGFLTQLGRTAQKYKCLNSGQIPSRSLVYTIRDSSEISSTYLRAVIADADDPSATEKLLIKIKGNNLRMHCERPVTATDFSHNKWTIPSTVTNTRAEYIHNRADRHVVGDLSFQKQVVTITIINITESESGKYTCSADNVSSIVATDSREVEVFDKSGGRYVRLDENGGAIQVAGLKGETVKWLVDLTDFPSANITWIDPQGDPVNTAGESDAGARRVRTAWIRGAPQKLFVLNSLTEADRGVHRLRSEIGNGEVDVNVTVNVQEPPTVTLKELGSEQIFSERFGSQSNSFIGECEAFGSRELNVTVSFLICPKFPSLENHTRLNFDDNSTIYHRYEDPTSSGGKISNRFLMSSVMNYTGFVNCEACNRFGCNEAKAKHLYSDSEVPYFTSTFLNNSVVVLDLGTQRNQSLLLECFVGGTPYPSVTWFRNNVLIKEDYRHQFKYDNSELRIWYLYGDEGGQYKCRAENANGHIEEHINVKIKGAPEPADVFRASMIAVLVLLLLVIVICSVVIYRLLVEASRQKKINLAFRKGAPDRFDPELPILDQAHLLPYHLKWEYPRELLELGKILGRGAFGIVKKAKAKSICRGEAVTTVAVKLVRSSATLNFITALERELKILAYLGKHLNVVNLLGACTQNVAYGELFVIVEYCRFGNIRDYLLAGRAEFVDELHAVSETSGASSLGLDFADTNGSGLNSTVVGSNGVPATVDCGQSRENTGSGETSDDCMEDADRGDAPRWASKYRADDTDLDSEPISTRDLVYWSWQVSRAMDFLGKRKIIHGDLAARNILLSDKGIVKVCDFGLAKALCKEAEFRDKGVNPLPLRWMAIESIKDRVFSYQSDIWSFGVAMWEIFTLGETPYPGIRHRDLLKKLTDGYRLEHPKYATTSVYDVMRRCWEADPLDRPSFAELEHHLGDLLEDGFKAEYLAMHAHYMEVNAGIAENERQDYLALSLEPPLANGINEHIEMQILM